jgi:hypothetical protein
MDGGNERIADLRKFRVDARSALQAAVKGLRSVRPKLGVERTLFANAACVLCAISRRFSVLTAKVSYAGQNDQAKISANWFFGRKAEF